MNKSIFIICYTALVCPNCGSDDVQIVSKNGVHTCNNCGEQGSWEYFEND